MKYIPAVAATFCGLLLLSATSRAQTALANSANMSDEEATAMEAGLKRNLAMLGVKRRRRSA
jgi:hypothetical protein